MTNGEKLKTLFPTIKLSYDILGQRRIFDRNMLIADDEWWDTEYKEIKMDKCICIECKNKCYEYESSIISDKSYYEWSVKKDKCSQKLCDDITNKNKQQTEKSCQYRDEDGCCWTDEKCKYQSNDEVFCQKQTELNELGYELGQKIEPTDTVSRQAVNTLVDELARAISDERCYISKSRSTATIMQDILDLPSIKLQQPTSPCDLCRFDYMDGYCGDCHAMAKGEWE